MSVEKLHKKALQKVGRSLNELRRELSNEENPDTSPPGEIEAYRVDYKNYLRGEISTYEYLLTLLDGSNGDWNIAQEGK